MGLRKKIACVKNEVVLTFTLEVISSCTSGSPLVLHVPIFAFVATFSCSIVLTLTSVTTHHTAWLTVVCEPVTHAATPDTDVFDGVVILCESERKNESEKC